MTYGVPNIPSARLLECGLESRVLAVRLAAELGLQFTKKRELENWLDQHGEEDPLKFTDRERKAWRSFLAMNNRKYESWTRHEIMGKFDGGVNPAN